MRFLVIPNKGIGWDTIVTPGRNTKFIPNSELSLEKLAAFGYTPLLFKQTTKAKKDMIRD
jgi:hypothetical protein